MKKFITPALLTVTYSFFAMQAFAATSIGTACPGNGFSILCFQANQLGSVIASAITFIFVIVAIAALGFLVWGGFKWLISEGDKNAVEAARNHIVNAIIGLIVIFLSYLIINVLLAFFTGGQVTLINLKLPTIGNPQ